MALERAKKPRTCLFTTEPVMIGWIHFIQSSAFPGPDKTGGRILSFSHAAMTSFGLLVLEVLDSDFSLRRSNPWVSSDILRCAVVLVELSTQTERTRNANLLKLS